MERTAALFARAVRQHTEMMGERTDRRRRVGRRGRPGVPPVGLVGTVSAPGEYGWIVMVMVAADRIGSDARLSRLIRLGLLVGWRVRSSGRRVWSVLGDGGGGLGVLLSRLIRLGSLVGWRVRSAGW